MVIPCRNEAGSLPGVLAAVPSGYLALVVDNGSDDATASVARQQGALVVTEPVPGYGAAVQRGIESATTPIVCVLDGDGSLDPGELPGLVALLRSGADLAVGRRVPEREQAGRCTPGSETPSSRPGSADGSVCRCTISVPSGPPAPGHCSTWVWRTGRSGYPLELLVRAGRAGLRVEELPVSYRPRTAGRSKVSGSVVGSAIATWDFLKVIR